MEEKKNVSNPPGAIYRAIPGVMSDVGAVSRDKVNKQQGWKFRVHALPPKFFPVLQTFRTST